MPQRTPRANAVRLLCCCSFVAPSPAVDGGLAMLRVLGRMGEELRAHGPRYASLLWAGSVQVGLGHTCSDELAFGNCRLLAVAGSDGDGGEAKAQDSGRRHTCLVLGRSSPGGVRAGGGHPQGHRPRPQVQNVAMPGPDVSRYLAYGRGFRDVGGYRFESCGLFLSQGQGRGSGLGHLILKGSQDATNPGPVRQR
ncbi:MAG: hypothetical protein LBP92_06720 [Deltaproteobacteria bacterium]|nr:hypothetical protein [Deltaproteobacteria bacterium]